MSQLACRYAIVQFLPYAETGEFANVGVILLCPEARFFGYRLETRRSGRITNFFEQLDRETYTRALRLFREELDRIAGILRQTAFGDRLDADLARQVLTDLAHPREAIVRIGPVRALLADTPKQALEQLFGHYVEHDFVTREYQERVLEKHIKALLRGLHLARPFNPDTVGNEELHARFPFVQREGEGGRPLKIIKPFHLAQDEPNKIYDHADPWLKKVRRLRDRNLLPDRVLFTVTAPPREDERRFKAFEEIEDELIDLRVQVVYDEEDTRIAEFAAE